MTPMVFASSYDGGHQAYMDDFINKVAWGLNLVFSSGVGWPRTDWLLLRGARREHLLQVLPAPAPDSRLKFGTRPTRAHAARHGAQPAHSARAAKRRPERGRRSSG